MVALATAICLLMLVFALAAAKASAGGANFCTNAWLAPYGQGGDRCWGPSQRGTNQANVVTFTRAGCVSIASGSNTLLTSWVCGAASSAPQTAATVYYNKDLEQFRKGVIRNNNLSYSGQFSGGQSCAWPGC